MERLFKDYGKRLLVPRIYCVDTKTLSTSRDETGTGNGLEVNTEKQLTSKWYTGGHPSPGHFRGPSTDPVVKVSLLYWRHSKVGVVRNGVFG